jgi:hypothetical protein
MEDDNIRSVHNRSVGFNTQALKQKETNTVVREYKAYQVHYFCTV